MGKKLMSFVPMFAAICLFVFTVATAVAQTDPVIIAPNDLFMFGIPEKTDHATRPITIIAARNGVFSGKVVIQSPKPINGLHAQISEIKSADAHIAAEDIQLRYGVEWERYAGRYRPGGQDVLLLSPPETILPNKGKALAEVWVTITIPTQARPGNYRGSLTVELDGQSARTIPLELKLTDWTLPDTQDFRTWVGMIQSPDSLALEYDVPLWSEQHWQLIARSFQIMNGLGCRNVFIPILCKTNFGNEQSMVRWIIKGENQYDFDFTIMEKYLDLAEQHLGKPKMVTFQVWELYLAERSLKRSVRTEEIKAARQAIMGKGPRVTMLDPDTGETQTHYLPRFEDPVSKTIWQPLFDQLHRRMQQRGLEDTMMLGMVSDVWPSKQEVQMLDEVSGHLPWASHAHPGKMTGKPAQGNKIIHKIADLGYEAHVYNLGYQVNPDLSRHYGWKQPQLIVRFARNGWPNSASQLQMRLLPAFNITGDQRGIGRLGTDVWYVIKNKRGRRSGAVYHRYPEVNWRNLDIENWITSPGPDGALPTARYENLREGLQECEARIAIESALLDPAKRTLLGDDLIARCTSLLNDRQRAMWKSIWTDDEDLDSKDRISARHPIEALWQAMAKSGKELPGYWDGEARKIRRDEEYKGRLWFADSGWQRRNEQLFLLAAEVERKSTGTAAIE